MPTLFLVEFVPTPATADASQQLIEDIGSASTLIEAQVTSDNGRVFAIVEAEDAAAATGQLSTLEPASDPAAVRLVGAELADVKAARPEAGYLVEWDIPAEITMEQYLARKKANSPKYAEVPEVSFLRTYVREDTAKCLCFYNAPDEAAVERARQAVGTPFDRLFKLNV